MEQRLQSAIANFEKARKEREACERQLSDPAARLKQAKDEIAKLESSISKHLTELPLVDALRSAEGLAFLRHEVATTAPKLEALSNAHAEALEKEKAAMDSLVQVHQAVLESQSG